MADIKSPFDMFDVDENLEEKGIRVDYGPFWFQIGRIDRAGTAFARFMTERFRPYTRAIQLGEMDNKIAETITREGFAKHLTFAWGSKSTGKDGKEVVHEGKMPGKDGVLLDFTPENVEQLYSDLPALFNDLLAESKNMRNFRRAKAEIDAGN